MSAVTDAVELADVPGAAVPPPAPSEPPSLLDLAALVLVEHRAVEEAKTPCRQRFHFGSFGRVSAGRV
jgi:hypothetical protein